MSDDYLKKGWLEGIVRDCAVQAMAEARMLASALQDKDSLVFGDIKLDPQEIIAKVADEYRTGVLSALAQVNAREAQRHVHEAALAAERLP